MTFSVSVCMITYNHEKYIIDAIEGVLMQKTGFLIQLVIGEDYSTDNTRVICEEYAQRYPDKIKLLPSDRNYGVMHNFLRTINECSGKYIALCEGDDYWTDPYKLQKQIDVLDVNPQYSMCFHNAYMIWEGKKKRREFCGYKKTVYNTIDLIEKKWFIPTQSIVYRKSVYEYEEWMNYVLGGDYALQLFLSTKGDIAYINEIMSVYRKNPGSLGAKLKPGYSALRTLELLSYFNYYTEFKYDVIVKKRINMMRDGLYFSLLMSRPKFIKYLNIDTYLHIFPELYAFLKKKYLKM